MNTIIILYKGVMDIIISTDNCPECGEISFRANSGFLVCKECGWEEAGEEVVCRVCGESVPVELVSEDGMCPECVDQTELFSI